AHAHGVVRLGLEAGERHGRARAGRAGGHLRRADRFAEFLVGHRVALTEADLVAADRAARGPRVLEGDHRRGVGEARRFDGQVRYGGGCGGRRRAGGRPARLHLDVHAAGAGGGRELEQARLARPGIRRRDRRVAREDLTVLAGPVAVSGDLRGGRGGGRAAGDVDVNRDAVEHGRLAVVVGEAVTGQLRIRVRRVVVRGVGVEFLVDL